MLIKKVENNNTNKRPVFIITYDPRLPSITEIVKKHWRSMVKDPYLADVFKKSALIAYKRAQNIKDKIIRAKVPPLAPLRPKRALPGMSRCKGYPICPLKKQGKSVRAVASYTAEILQEVNCKSKNVIYCIECRKCKNQYIGETDMSLQNRFSEHRGYVNRKMLTKSTGEHFKHHGIIWLICK